MEEQLLLENDEPGDERVVNKNRDLVIISTDFPVDVSFSSQPKEFYSTIDQNHQYTNLNSNSSSDRVVIISENDTDSVVFSDEISTQNAMSEAR